MFDHKGSRGVPRWKAIEQYAYADDLTDLQWRWEFLRRRPDYRDAWTEHFDEWQTRYDCLHLKGLLDDRERYRSAGTTYRSVCEPFCVERIAAPWLDKPGVGFWKLPYGWALGTLSENVKISSLVSESENRERQGQMLFAFDINRPFDDQVPRIRSHFEAVQKERKGQILSKNRHHKRKWATYLQAIDARDQGATYENLYLEIELSNLSTAEYDAALDKNLAASGLQLWRQAYDLMFKVTS